MNHHFVAEHLRLCGAIFSSHCMMLCCKPARDIDESRSDPWR
jgi:hypothetical protein